TTCEEEGRPNRRPSQTPIALKLVAASTQSSAVGDQPRGPFGPPLVHTRPPTQTADSPQVPWGPNTSPVTGSTDHSLVEAEVRGRVVHTRPAAPTTPSEGDVAL